MSSQKAAIVNQLQAVSDILHLAHHRNRNQHRRSRWWKWLSMLKRCVGKLIRDMVGGDRRHVQTRVQYMNEILLPKCYRSFTQLIHDVQFSPLGLTLLAEIARIRRTLASSDTRGNDGDCVANIGGSSGASAVSQSQDLGDVVDRSSPLGPTHLYPSPPAPHPPTLSLLSPVLIFDGPHDPQNQQQHEPDPVQSTEGITNVSTLQGSLRPTRTTRRKQGNAIDDLFHGLN